MKLAIVIFSATGNTKKMGKILKKEFARSGAVADILDITTPEKRENRLDLSDYPAIVFGFPIHSLRAPKVVRQWLGTLNGEGKKASMFFTYGGFSVHPAHATTRAILEKRNFTVVSSAEFPGAHTFNIGGWQAFPTRPDTREFQLAEKYAEKTYKRFTGEDSTPLGQLDCGEFTPEQLDQFESFRFKIITRLPSRTGNACRLCGLCGQACPVNAMDFKKGQAGDQCIACLRCVASCPDQVLTINNTAGSWESKLAMGGTCEPELNRQTGKIYL